MRLGFYVGVDWVHQRQCRRSNNATLTVPITLPLNPYHCLKCTTNNLCWLFQTLRIFLIYLSITRECGRTNFVTIMGFREHSYASITDCVPNANITILWTGHINLVWRRIVERCDGTFVLVLNHRRYKRLKCWQVIKPNCWMLSSNNKIVSCIMNCQTANNMSLLNKNILIENF